MKNALLKVLADCDDTIRESMLQSDGKHEAWEYMADPVLTALVWHMVRKMGK
jgi:hypothetical protein